jgi:hypothetical protein
LDQEVLQVQVVEIQFLVHLLLLAEVLQQTEVQVVAEEQLVMVCQDHNIQELLVKETLAVGQFIMIQVATGLLLVLAEEVLTK